MMERVGLLDTGPLVSFLGAGLEHHAWAVEQWKELPPPLLTCEPVLTEAAFLLKHRRTTDAPGRCGRQGSYDHGGAGRSRLCGL